MVRIIHEEEGVVFSSEWMDDTVDKVIEFLRDNNYMIVYHDYDDNGDMIIEVWKRSAI